MRIVFQFETPERGYAWLFTTCLNFYHWKAVEELGSVTGFKFSILGYGLSIEALAESKSMNQGEAK